MSPRAHERDMCTNPFCGPGLWVWRAVCLLALAGTVWFILWHSAQPAAISGAQSRGVLAAVNRLFQACGLPEVSEHAVRKAAHFAEFAALGWWLLLCARAFFVRLGQRWPWLWAAGVLCAVLDESLQLIVPGRAARISDVLLDTCGVGAGMACAACALWLWRRRRV